jgi:SAM-dependent methyltransferase
MEDAKNDDIRRAVREKYGRVAKAGKLVCGCTTPSTHTCCGANKLPLATDMSIAVGYSTLDLSLVPDGANMGLGCGNPQSIASLKTGEKVLDLGSGGGFDCFLAAKAVGETGSVIGVDMTPEMISKARLNAIKANVSNVEFRLSEIEALPVADNAVDVLMSNCVINLSPEKQRVYSEAFRVLKPGGRLAISDIVAVVELPIAVKNDMTLHCGCVAGASTIQEIEEMLSRTGFEEIRISPNVNSKAVIRDLYPERGIENYVLSATIEATKPKV